MIKYLNNFQGNTVGIYSQCEIYIKVCWWGGDGGGSSFSCYKHEYLGQSRGTVVSWIIHLLVQT